MHRKPFISGPLQRVQGWPPPWRDRRFWATQLMVAAITGLHDLVEAGGYLPHLGMLYFVPISLFSVPLVYAGLHFGLSGSLATSAWVTLITFPNWIFWHSGTERWGVIFQLAVVMGLAALVGARVDRERESRVAAERAAQSLRVYEENLRDLARQAVRSQEQERLRIAHELHDEAVQIIVALSRQLDDLAARATGAEPVRERVQEARRLAEQAARSIRDVIQGLRPLVLEDLGLVPALRHLLAETRSSDGPAVSLRVIGRPRRFDPERELGVYRIAQEAVCNVFRHSRASAAGVCVTFGRERLLLVVRDNGVGMSGAGGLGGRDRPSGRDGLGVIGMMERARSMGGELFVYSRPGRGTVVRLVVPDGAAGSAARAPDQATIAGGSLTGA